MRARYTWMSPVAMVTGALFFGLPIAWIFLLSIMPPKATFEIPPRLLFTPTLDSYRELFSGFNGIDIFLYIRNSVLASAGSTILVLVTCLLGAYATTQFRFRGRSVTLAAILVARTLPPIAMVVPTYLYVSRLHMLDQVRTLVVIYAAIILPFTFWLMHSFLNTLPTEVLDAARVDGCGTARILARIVLPLAAPGLISAGLFAFTVAWTEFPLAAVLTQNNAKTLPLLINSFQSSSGVDWGPMAAGAIVAIAPPMAVLLLGQRWLVAGLTAGVGK